MQTLIVHVRENFARVFVGRMIEWEHSIMLMLFGLVLIDQPELFGAAASYSFFRAMYDSYAFWGLAALSVGAIRFAVLLVNGTIRRSPHLRAALAMMTAFFWFAAAYGAVVSDKLTPLTVISASFFGWQFVIFMICIRYAKLEDIKAVPNARQTHS
jgi:hypothetical protein